MSFENLVTQLTTHWEFDYEPKVKALRDLYEVAKKEQWNVSSDINWNLEIDKEGDILARPQDPMRELDIVRALKRIHSHICAVAFPILDEAGQLYHSRLKRFDREAMAFHRPVGE